MHKLFDIAQCQSDTILQDINKIVKIWHREKTGDEYYLAVKRMSCLHRLLQVQNEITKALEVHLDYNELATLKGTIETQNITLV